TSDTGPVTAGRRPTSWRSSRRGKPAAWRHRTADARGCLPPSAEPRHLSTVNLTTNYISGNLIRSSPFAGQEVFHATTPVARRRYRGVLRRGLSSEAAGDHGDETHPGAGGARDTARAASGASPRQDPAAAALRTGTVRAQVGGRPQRGAPAGRRVLRLQPDRDPAGRPE